jgi:type II secretory pathway pseudopilin PulG
MNIRPNPVAQIFNLLYRRISFCRRPTPSPTPGLTGRTSPLLPRSQAFTMIEITISLAIIGFALVAIIGVLPLGMTAQRDNRQETIVNQDQSVLMDAVRNGERGLDDLTNYVIGITNYAVQYPPSGGQGRTLVSGYSVQGSTLNGALSSPQYPLTNGYSIIGLLSTPKIIPVGLGFLSNHVVAVFRSLSGPASEKPPQLNPTMQELGLSYRVVADVSGYGTNFFFPTWTNFTLSGLSTNDIATRSNYMVLVQNLQADLHDLRLTFLWPMLPSGKVGGGRQVYRTMVAGRQTNDPPGSPFFFFQPRTYF